MTTTRAHPDDGLERSPRPPAASSYAPSMARLWLRVAALLALGVALIPLYAWFAPVATAGAGEPAFGWLLSGVSALYVAACVLILRTQPAGGAWRWAELALILLVGLALRTVVFGAAPGLSPDAYRYAWDPHLIVHGFSPYTHTPLDPALTALRDHNIWPNIRFRNAPTIYPPAAQGMFLLVYAFAPLNIVGVKAAIEVCDALSCALMLILLRTRGLDLRRVALYWWAPIPIIEFAFNAHVDAEAILWTLAALALNTASWRGARVATGVLLGLAALTKFYPLLFVIALIRRRDYGLLAGLAGTLALGYAPFIPLGLGSGGFLGAYLSQRYVDQGVLLSWLDFVVTTFTRFPPALVASDLLALALACGLIALGRWRLSLDPVTALLALSCAWIALSPHIYPWYIGALLPLIALTRGAWLSLTPSGLACWLFSLSVPYTYIIFLPGRAAWIFPWLFLAAAAVGLAPLLTARGRATFRAGWRRLFAAPTLDEAQRVWSACLPARLTRAPDTQVSAERGEHT